MIERETALILGAGASEPYGFPSGHGMLLGICENLRSRTNLVTFLERLGHSPQESHDFGVKLYDSQQPSVDAYLEGCNSQAEIAIGKAAIAWYLVQRELPDELMNRERDGAWYHLLFQAMYVPNTPDEFSHGKVRIITFNYDRSLEEFLWTAVQSSYGLDRNEAARVIQRVPIVHVYGTSGVHPAMSSDGHDVRPYAPTMSDNSLTLARDTLRIMSDPIGDDPLFARVHGILRSAEVICFLGFGFHSQNLTRLRLASVLGKEPKRFIIGTAYNCSPARRLAIKKALPRNPAITQRLLGAPQWRVHDFIDETGCFSDLYLPEEFRLDRLPD